MEDEIIRRVKEHLETNKNANRICQNVWDVSTVVLRGTFIAINTSVTKLQEPKRKNKITFFAEERK